MGALKHIERTIGGYIGSRYRYCAEIGVGNNFDAAIAILDLGRSIFCTDVRYPSVDHGIPFFIDDVFSPDLSMYAPADVIYSVRPAIEMVPPLIQLARQAGCDLLVYHLGFEQYGSVGAIIDCGVILRQYHRHQKPSKSVF